MKVKYWLKIKIKILLLAKSRLRYADFCDAVKRQSDNHPPGIGILPRSYLEFLIDESWVLRKIYNW